MMTSQGRPRKATTAPDRATTGQRPLRSSDHTTVDYSRFDAVEVPEDVVIERRSWGPTKDKRTAPLRITLNDKRFTLAGPWLRRSVCDLGRTYLRSQKSSASSGWTARRRPASSSVYWLRSASV